MSRRIDANWPRMTSELAEKIVLQASDALSIYDRSGIVATFEDKFRAHVGADFALATSSGTAALHSAYYGVGLAAGDEVICSEYGFFATVAPLVHVGTLPVFVDCYADGTIDVEQAEAAITERTRAIVVTHMWGQPGRLVELRQLCDRFGLRLIEDCSHAHGASYQGRSVGSFGDAAAWSLQANKTIWAGEGGVLCTSDRSVYERAMLLGHFNRRSLNEIPTDSPNYAYAFTGVGLKYRAHPLGLALATPQLDGLAQLIQNRQTAAKQISDALRSVPGIDLVGGSTEDITHGYYALAATVDPSATGFDREAFHRALQDDDIHTSDIPRQMCSMRSFPLFANFRCVRDGQVTDDALPNSHRITETLIKFFVPGHWDEDDHAFIVAEAIGKVAASLRAARA